MSDEGSPSDPEPRIAQEASAWVLRSDRGLSPREQDEFSEWLAADPRHGAQLARQRRHWQRLNSLAQWRPEHGEKPNPDLLAPRAGARLRRFAPHAALMAAAVAAALVVFRGGGGPRPSAAPAFSSAAATAAPASTTRTLPDDTLVELNRDAELTVAFTRDERRVRLDRGEAHFAVAKNPDRPFIVQAAGVEVRAVGTAFNVRLDAATLEVLVTEGRVGVNRASIGVVPPADAEPAPPALQLAARQRAVVSLKPDSPPPQVATLTTGEIDRVLAWQHRLLDFTAAPMRDIVAEFNRRNVIQIVVVDPELADTRISAAFRTDNLAGFVHLIEAGFGAVAERPNPDQIVLRRVQR